MDYNPPGSPVHGILQAGVLERVAIPFSRGYSQPREIEPRSPALQADSLLSEPPREPILPAVQKTLIPSLGWEDPLEKGMATLSSILA